VFERELSIVGLYVSSISPKAYEVAVYPVIDVCRLSSFIFDLWILADTKLFDNSQFFFSDSANN